MIHLWNIRSGKVLRVGSIALLKENGRLSSRRLQLSDILLLLLRCLLIVLLALLLAKPGWRSSAVKKDKGWVLMERGSLRETYRQFQSQIDTLLQAGYSFHYLMPGFPGEDLSVALQDAEEAGADSVSYWVLLDSLQQYPHAPANLFLFTPHYLGRFQGPRPQIDTGVQWFVFKPTDSVSSWQADAYATASGGIRVRKVTSRAEGNSYEYEELLTGTADTSTKEISIFADTYIHDAVYLKAAITAIQEFAERKIKISLVSQPTALPRRSDWLFWLSMQPLPAEINAKNIWRYDSGTVVNMFSWVLSPAVAPVPLFKRIQSTAPATVQPLWKDGFGDAVLYRESGTNSNIYHFSSRLDPAWNELPWNAAFPALLLQLLYPDTSIVPLDKDRRAIAAQQLLPDQYGTSVPDKERVLPVIDLAPACWLLVLALFLTERLLVFGKKKTTLNG